MCLYLYSAREMWVVEWRAGQSKGFTAECGSDMRAFFSIDRDMPAFSTIVLQYSILYCEQTKQIKQNKQTNQTNQTLRAYSPQSIRAQGDVF